MVKRAQKKLKVEVIHNKQKFRAARHISVCVSAGRNDPQCCVWLTIDWK